jgi:hypothetical protein
MDPTTAARATSAAARQIPGFGGDIFLPGTPGYDEKRVQYAACSYPERMRPHLIAVRRTDSEDVPAAIRFAKANKKYLVARSGGHQYSGLSSGGEDTILLTMERFKHLKIKTAGGKTVAQVGVGMLLTDVAAEFKRHGVASAKTASRTVCSKQVEKCADCAARIGPNVVAHPGAVSGSPCRALVTSTHRALVTSTHSVCRSGLCRCAPFALNGER